MSLFGSMLREFEEDPIFNVHREQMRRVERMMDDFMSPFEGLFAGGGGFRFPQLMAPPDNIHVRQRDPFQQLSLMPYGGGFGRSMFPDIGSMFSGMDRMAQDPNCHMYSSSSVVSYSMGEDGQPKLYQASSSTRTAPGGVKETRKSMSDSTTGVQKMAIGHHLGERAHIVEKSQNRLTGQQDESEEFINIEDTEATDFNEEWCRRTIHASGASQPRITGSPSLRDSSPPPPQLAITAGPSGPSNGPERHGRKRDKDDGRISDDHPSLEKSRRTNGHKRSHSGKPKHETSM